MWYWIKQIGKTLSYAAQLFIVIGVAFLFLVNQKPTSIEIIKAQQIAHNCPGLVLTGDVLASAQQIGRLDYVSLGLTILGVIIALLAMGGFWVLRRETLDVAKDHCAGLIEKEAQALTEEEVRKYLGGSQGTQRLEEIVRQRVSAIIEDESVVNLLVERLAPLVRDANLEFDKNFGSSTVHDDEIEQLLQELAREDEAELEDEP